MSNATSNIKWKYELFGSRVFGEQYENRLTKENDSASSLFTYKEVQDLYNSILIEYHTTDFQKTALQETFHQFDLVRSQIDPERLRHFKCSKSVDDEILLFRKSTLGLTNIIIHEDETIAFSFIPFNPDKQTTLDFYNLESDFELLALRFFSN